MNITGHLDTDGNVHVQELADEHEGTFRVMEMFYILIMVII